MTSVYVETQVSVLRKVCCAVYLVREAAKCHTDDKIITKMTEQTCDSQEVDLILEYLQPHNEKESLDPLSELLSVYSDNDKGGHMFTLT